MPCMKSVYNRNLRSALVPILDAAAPRSTVSIHTVMAGYSNGRRSVNPRTVSRMIMEHGGFDNAGDGLWVKR